MHSSNEGKAIHAAVKLLEAIQGQAATEGENPDRRGKRRGIDWRMRIGETAYSMEHTEVEPYPGERIAGETVEKVAAHLDAAAPNLGGPGCYDVILAPDAKLANGPMGELQLESMIRWMEETAAEWPPLHPQPRLNAPMAIEKVATGRPDRWPNDVTLQRLHAWYAALMDRPAGSVSIFGREAPNEQETLRMQAASVERAFGKRKTGKLNEDSAEHESQTVLVLEARQIAFHNIDGIGEAVRGLPPATRNAVDIVVLVETASNSCWYATLLKQGDWTRPSGAPPEGLRMVEHGNEPTRGRSIITDPRDIIKVRVNELIDLTHRAG